MAKKRTIDDWRLGAMFGEHIIVGYIDSQPVTAIWRAWARKRFYLSWGSKAAEEVVKQGRQLAPFPPPPLDPGK